MALFLDKVVKPVGEICRLIKNKVLSHVKKLF
jgi:hypothetical protein